MNDEQINALFRTVADHLECLATRIRNAKKLQEEDRAREKADPPRLDRLERVLKSLVRVDARERKEWHDRLNALRDIQTRSDATSAAFQAQMSEFQKKANECQSHRQ